jgi:hypothetical protein
MKTGSKITGNTASSEGGGVYVYGTFEMSGRTISGKKASSEGGGVYAANGGTFKKESAASFTGQTKPGMILLAIL